MKYLIYGKTQEMKKFKPVGTGGLVGNLIYAYMYEKSQDATSDMKKLQDLNPDVKFEVRRLK